MNIQCCLDSNRTLPTCLTGAIYCCIRIVTLRGEKGARAPAVSAVRIPKLPTRFLDANGLQLLGLRMVGRSCG